MVTRAYLSQNSGANPQNSMRPSSRNSHRFVAARDKTQVFLRPLARVGVI
jgi:hypothetical protein